MLLVAWDSVSLWTSIRRSRPLRSVRAKVQVNGRAIWLWRVSNPARRSRIWAGLVKSLG